MTRRFIFVGMLSALLLVGCDRDASAPSSNGSNTGQEHLVVEVSAITPLLPRLRTHLAVDSRGNLYWLQESEAPGRGDLVFGMGSSGVPQAISALSVPNLLTAAGHTGNKGGGAIRAMAVGPDDQLYVLFTGEKGRAMLILLARYNPTTHQVKVVADSNRLMSESALGASLELARGSLLACGQNLWLWLRHTDDAAMLKIIPKGDGVQFDRLKLKTPEGMRNVRSTSDQEDLSAGPRQELYYVDRPRAMLWKIDAAGEFSAVLSLDGFSAALTAPAADDAGHLWLLAGEGEQLVDTTVLDRTAPPPGSTRSAWSKAIFPAMLQIEGDKALTIWRDDFLAPASLPVQKLQPRHLLLDRATGSLITFDAATGELLKLKVAKK